VYSGPSREDLELFVSYLIQLIHGCDLEHVALLLRFIQRFVALGVFQRLMTGGCNLAILDSGLAASHSRNFGITISVLSNTCFDC